MRISLTLQRTANVTFADVVNNDQPTGAPDMFSSQPIREFRPPRSAAGYWLTVLRPRPQNGGSMKRGRSLEEVLMVERIVAQLH